MTAYSSSSTAAVGSGVGIAAHAWTGPGVVRPRRPVERVVPVAHVRAWVRSPSLVFPVIQIDRTTGNIAGSRILISSFRGQDRLSLRTRRGPHEDHRSRRHCCTTVGRARGHDPGRSGAGRVPPAAIYRLFGDKEGLIRAVAEAAMETYSNAKAAAADDHLSPVEALRVAWRRHIDFGLANPELYVMLGCLQPPTALAGDRRRHPGPPPARRPNGFRRSARRQ